MDLRFIDISKVKNDTLFEDLTKELLAANPKYSN